MGDALIMRIVPIILVIFLLLGCGKEKPVSTRPADKVIATVNGEPIYLKDFKLALALRVRDDPTFKIAPNTLDEQIDMMVNECLLLQGKEKSKSDIKIYTELLKVR